MSNGCALKWKQTAKYSMTSNQGHKLFIAYIYGEDKSIYTVFSPGGNMLGTTEDRDSINRLVGGNWTP